jgi:hypothetical protein
MVSKTFDKTIKNKQHDTQVVISPIYDDSFIILKNFGSYRTIITPFVAYDDNAWDSDFVVPENRLFRIQNLYDNIKAIASYTISVDRITFNCLKDFPVDIFPPQAATGWLHFNHTSITTKNENDKKPTIVNQIDDRIVFEQIEDAEIEQSGIYQMEFEIPTKISFQAKDLKVFPVIFDRGFALTIADEKKATLYLTLNDINKLYAGVCSQSELNNLIHNILPLFPFFSCNVNEKNANIFLKNISDFKAFFGKTNLTKAMLRFRYYFNNPKICTCRVIGK